MCRHVLEVCPGVEHLRVSLGIGEFFNKFRAGGKSSAEAYSAYLNGLGIDGNKVGLTVHLARGLALKDLQEGWLGLWGN